MSTTAVVILAIVIVALVAVAAWLFSYRRRSDKLRARFGPEYSEALRRHGDRRRAELALEARQKRMEQIHIRRLQPEERDRFATQWHAIQAEFVDSPLQALQGADRLVSELMLARGYPMAEFERRAEDLSVDHPHVVRNYRAAHEIALAKEHAGTEELRRGFVHCRDLFDELLEVAAQPGRKLL